MSKFDDLAPAALQIDRQQTPVEQFAESGEELDRLRCLERTHRARDRSQHPRDTLRTGAERLPVGEQIGIAPAAAAVEDRHLAAERADRAVHPRHPAGGAGVIEQEAGRKVVAAVDHDIVARHDFADVSGRDPLRMEFETGIGRKGRQPLARRFGLGHPHLRRGIGMVLQEPFLFSKTFRESIADGARRSDLETVRKYARMAVIDDAIEGFAQGYETPIGERGVTISGGQKQRVAIARMLMQDTPIKVFDDSLSAVDMETDAKIRQSIKENVHGTTILIAHRITTLMNADQILVLEKGKVAQMGTHQELIAQDGIYKRIYDMQKS